MWGLNVVFSPDPRVRRNGTEYIRKHVPLLFLADRALLSITLQKIRAANVCIHIGSGARSDPRPALPSLGFTIGASAPSCCTDERRGRLPTKEQWH